MRINRAERQVYMGYKCSFLDNEVYGADDVSEAFSNIVSGGVRTVYDGENVTETLNELTGEVVTSGTRSYSDLKVTISGEVITIGEGVGYFDSGVSVKVDEAGIVLNKGERASGYVSILYDADFNKVLPQITDSSPSGDVLVLARFNGESVTDLRSYARSKLSINSANNYHDFTIKLSSFTNFNGTYAGSSTTYKMPHTGFKYLLMRNAQCSQLQLYRNEPIMDISKEGTQKYTLSRSNPLIELKVDRTGDMLTFTAYYAYMNYPQTYEFTLV